MPLNSHFVDLATRLRSAEFLMDAVHRFFSSHITFVSFSTPGRQRDRGSLELCCLTPVGPYLLDGRTRSNKKKISKLLLFCAISKNSSGFTPRWADYWRPTYLVATNRSNCSQNGTRTMQGTNVLNRQHRKGGSGARFHYLCHFLHVLKSEA
jgi:hypothetical protein